MTELKKIEGFDRELILYAKGWYGHSRDNNRHITYYDDIAALLCKFAAIDSVSKHDVFELTMDAFLEYVPHSHQKEGFRRLFVWKSREEESVTINELLEMAIGKLSVVKIKGCYDLDPTDLLPIRFGDKKDELPQEDGTSGQDRKSYTDEQDRESYTVSTE